MRSVQWMAFREHAFDPSDALRRAAAHTQQRGADTFNSGTPSCCCASQEFHVIKINKWGARQPRILGMDRSTIYNMMPKRERTLVGSVRRTQHPDREIEDIEAIRQPDPARPVYFEIEYKNKQTPTDRIECHSRRDVQELLLKLRFLMELHRSTPRTRWYPQPWHSGGYLLRCCYWKPTGAGLSTVG